MLKDIDLTEYRKAYFPQIQELFNVSFNKEMTKEYFLWKYERAPWSSKGYVAVYDSKVVAFYGGIRMRFEFGGRELWAYQFCDVMTHPGYRGRFVTKTPLIVSLGEMFYRENKMDFAFGFPSLRHARLQSLRLGGEGYRLVRLYKKERLKRRFLTWKLRIEEGWESFKKGEMKEFLLKHDDRFLHLAKDEAYIKWRYINNPLKEYRLLVFSRINKTRGFIVFTVEDGWFNILEIFYMDIKDLVDMLVSVEAYLARNIRDIKGIRAWHHQEEPARDYLEDFGYSHEDSVPIAFRAVDSSSGITSDIFYNRYFYRMGDYDVS